MERSYYEQYFHLERNHWWFVVRSRIIKALIQKNFNTKLSIETLNVGIATGATSIMLESFGDVVSSEFDKETCEFVEKEIGIKVIQASVTELPFESDRFDMVCAFDVIEHVEDDQKAILELERVLKPGGLMVLTVPANMSLWSEHDMINHHFRRYEKRGLSKLLSGTKMCPMYLSYFNTLLFPAIKCARWLNSFKSKKEKPQSDFDIPTPTWLNHVLAFIFSLEIPLLKRIKFPFGVSLILLAKKEK